jgi:hypothetical protein
LDIYLHFLVLCMLYKTYLDVTFTLLVCLGFWNLCFWFFFKLHYLFSLAFKITQFNFICLCELFNDFIFFILHFILISFYKRMLIILRNLIDHWFLYTRIFKNYFILYSFFHRLHNLYFLDIISLLNLNLTYLIELILLIIFSLWIHFLKLFNHTLWFLRI